MSDLAEVALAAAPGTIARWLEAEHGAPAGAGELIVVGMGKLGGRELNVSSDIDLIFVYPEEGETRTRRANARPLSNHEFFTRLGRRLISALAEHDRGRPGVPRRHAPAAHGATADRSRAASTRSSSTSSPRGANGSATPGSRRASSRARRIRAAMAERGLERDRCARPFVFRKYLDFGAFAAMRELHAQIRAEVARRDLADHIKLGSGRNPRDRVHRPGIPADPRRARRRTAGAPDAARCSRCSRERRLLPRGRRGRACRSLRLPAPARAPPAVPRRRPDAQAARGDEATARSSPQRWASPPGTSLRRGARRASRARIAAVRAGVLDAGTPRHALAPLWRGDLDAEARRGRAGRRWAFARGAELAARLRAIRAAPATQTCPRQAATASTCSCRA